MNANNKNILDSVIYSYSTTTNQYEEENRVLKETCDKMKIELDKFKQPPLMVAEVYESYGESALIKIPNGNQFSVNVSGECGKLKPGDMVLAEQKNLTVIKKITSVKVFNVDKFVIIEKPTVTWKDIGGLEHQTRELKEVIELPMMKPELFQKVGIEPPKGVLLYGPPGTGKTLLAKAVASSTNSTFIGVVASELVQKFIGEGAKLVKEIFELAREKAPSIVFIDEIDALAATRMEIGTSGEREVNRTFMQLLSELDGFKPLDNVKIIGATNRKDILDPAITRPGRLDRLIQVPIPDKEGRYPIFNIHSSRMKLDSGINVIDLVDLMENFSGAEIRAVCTEAGYFAIRENRVKILRKDIERAIEKVKESESKEGKDYLRMFG
ncbi:MAG TPA: AAA family ATPase [Candidatus Nanoarchaeia archaeon]|nr:AAA family ATPase [Candidatus Nanoarchaeia archaeon]